MLRFWKLSFEFHQGIKQYQPDCVPYNTHRHNRITNKTGLELQCKKIKQDKDHAKLLLLTSNIGS